MVIIFKKVRITLYPYFFNKNDSYITSQTLNFITSQPLKRHVLNCLYFDFRNNLAIKFVKYN